MDVVGDVDVDVDVDGDRCGELSTEHLEVALLRAAREQQQVRYRLLQLLAEYDQRGAWVTWGATSCAAWWAEVAGIERCTAREQLRVARALRELPQLARALATGRLSYAKVKAVSRLARAETVDELVALAERCPAGRLGVLLAGWVADRLDGDALAEAQHAARSLVARVEPDGMVVVTARLRPSDGEALRAALDAQLARADAPAGASLAQLRADALVALVAGPADGAGTSAEVVVHVHRRVDGEVVATLADGTPVPRTELGEVLCGASVRALVHDADGRPIDASPRRPGPTRRQQRLVQARDRCCQYRGCGSTAFLHVHHVVHREDGGPTTVGNLTLLCGFHHRLVHAREPAWRPPWWTDLGQVTRVAPTCTS